MKRVAQGIVAVLAAAVISGCSTGSETAGTAASVAPSEAEKTTSARPTLAAPNLQPPAQDGPDVNKNRPDVVFDPCTWIRDDAIRDAGFDPASRKRGEDFVAEYTFLTCRFESELIDISVMSGNVTLEEEIQKSSKTGPWQQQIMVNGRDATMGKDPELPGFCELNIRTAVGVVFLEQRLSLEGRIQKTDPCMNIERTAALIEQEIGEGN